MLRCSGGGIFWQLLEALLQLFLWSSHEHLFGLAQLDGSSKRPCSSSVHPHVRGFALRKRVSPPQRSPNPSGGRLTALPGHPAEIWVLDPRAAVSATSIPSNQPESALRPAAVAELVCLHCQLKMMIFGAWRRYHSAGHQAQMLAPPKATGWSRLTGPIHQSSC